MLLDKRHAGWPLIFNLSTHYLQHLRELDGRLVLAHAQHQIVLDEGDRLLVDTRDARARHLQR